MSVWKLVNPRKKELFYIIGFVNKFELIDYLICRYVVMWKNKLFEVD